MSKSKSKSKRKRPIVRGPQRALPLRGLKAPKSLGPSNDPPGMNARRRAVFIDPPEKRYGNPFLAARVPKELKAAWDRHCKGKSVADEFRAAIAKRCGFNLRALEADNDGE